MRRTEWTDQHPKHLRAQVLRVRKQFPDVCNEWFKDPRVFVEYLLTLKDCDDTDLKIVRINNELPWQPNNVKFSPKLKRPRSYRVL